MSSVGPTLSGGVHLRCLGFGFYSCGVDVLRSVTLLWGRIICGVHILCGAHFIYSCVWLMWITGVIWRGVDYRSWDPHRAQPIGDLIGDVLDRVRTCRPSEMRCITGDAHWCRFCYRDSRSSSSIGVYWTGRHPTEIRVGPGWVVEYYLCHWYFSVIDGDYL